MHREYCAALWGLMLAFRDSFLPRPVGYMIMMSWIGFDLLLPPSPARPTVCVFLPLSARSLARSKQEEQRVCSGRRPWC